VIEEYHKHTGTYNLQGEEILILEGTGATMEEFKEAEKRINKRR
jgi:hypothetical protein